MPKTIQGVFVQESNAVLVTTIFICFGARGYYASLHEFFNYASAFFMQEIYYHKYSP